MIIIILIIILLIFLIIYLFKKSNTIKKYNNFKLYVISLKQQNRLTNINNQQHKIGNIIEIIEGVNGDLLDENIMYDAEISINSLFDNNTQIKKREIGCYLSHYYLYNKIVNDNTYSIIFEDDFDIRTESLIEKCNTILATLKELQLEFDIIFLGNHDYQHNHGTLIKDNIYKLGNNEELHGTQGYIVNNKNIHKIIQYTKNITQPIDKKIQTLSDHKKLNVFAIYPYYVGQGKIPSVIRG
jgi:GR25 family glycosyltransferase involved in LPS biosynthesis